MAHLTSLLAAGLAVTLAWDAYVAPRAFSTHPVSTASGEAAAVQRQALAITNVDRSRKGDRLRQPPASTDARAVIARMEVGPGDTILLRDRAGDILFGADPAARRTTIVKNVVLPQLTVQTSSSPRPQMSPPPQPAAAPTMRQDPAPATTIGVRRRPDSQRPAGCDPSFSPIAAPELGHIFGRCVTTLPAPTRLALAQ
jgi:hypothetical protein